MYTPDQITEAKAALTRAVMAEFGGDLLGPALAGVDVPDSDAERYLDEQAQGIPLNINSYLS